ncbi:MAG: type II toxin-antitoxin system PemK/MazF family toxin [Clostridiales bacterium]|nr:type II toxin-antitoxin system PemK/MazF family toxin [Clostridiales bacterium]
MVNKWEIYFCNLNPTQGSEQQGKRPVLVISNDAVNHVLPVSTVLPLSSVKAGHKVYPTEVFLSSKTSGLPKDSVAMCQQIRTLSHDRFENLVSTLQDVDLQDEIKEALRQYLEL